MLFNSPEFLLFLPIVFGLYWFITRRIQSPVLPMREAVEAETMEVYKYSNTHLAEAGAQIVGEYLSKALQLWVEDPSN